MPTAGAKYIFKFGTQAEYDALLVKNPNTVYWLMDTNQIYVGDENFTAAISTLQDPPISGPEGVGTVGDPNKIYQCLSNGKLYKCTVTYPGGVPYYTWTEIAGSYATVEYVNNKVLEILGNLDILMRRIGGPDPEE